MNRAHLAATLLAVGIVLGLGVFALMHQRYPAVDISKEHYPNVYDIHEHSPSVKAETNGIYQDRISIDFDSCIPGKASVGVAFGSDHVVVKGSEGEDCILYLGGERENPRWDGRLSIKCRVPQSKGIQQFSSLRFDFLSEYTLLCVDLVPQTS